MYKKTLIFLFLSFFLVIAGYAGGQGENSADSGGSSEPLRHFNSYASPGFPVDKADNPILSYMFDQTGIDIKIEAVSANDFDTKLQLFAASGDLPDFWHHGTDIAINTAKWKQQGLIQPVGDLIDKYAPELRDFIPQAAFDAVTFDGQIWAIPAGFNPNDPAGGPNTDGYVLRKDWLDNLELSIPQTLNELHDVLYAFTYDDPDGNGVDDTFGMAMSKGIGSINAITNAYGVQASHWYDIDGKLVRGNLTERYLEALKVARSWYEEGLIDPEFPALDDGAMQTKVINGKVGSLWSHVWFPHPRWKVIPVMRETTPEAELIMIPAVEGPYGDRGYAPGNALLQTVWISSQTDQEEKIMKLLAWLAEGTNHLVPRIGIEGVDWEWNEAGNGYNFISDVNTTDQNAKVAYGLGNAGRMWPVIDRTPWRPEIESTFAAIEAHLLENKFIGAVQGMSEYPDIDQFLQEAVILYIIGSNSIDDVRSAQKKWYSEGGSIITSEVNELY